MPRKPLTIDEARAEAARVVEERWEGLYEDYVEGQRLASRFGDANPSEVVDMWETGRNEKGKPLSKFEGRALAERWAAVFGSLPPSMGEASTAPVPPPVPEPDDNKTLNIRQVAEWTGVSKSTIKRKVADGSFPKPRRLSERRIGWLATEVREWKAKLDEAG